jgi:two-component system, LytTR family, sensor kinase
MKTWLRRSALAVAAWTVIGCVFALPNLAAGGDWRRSLLASFAQWWSWGLLTPLIVTVGSRLPLPGKRLPRRLAAHLAFSLLFTAAYVYVYAALRAALGMGAWRALLDIQTLVSALRGMFLWGWLVYWLVAGAWQAYHYYKRYLASELRTERLEREFTEARLNALRMQLDPHFLFNALNTISSQVERNPKLARGMIEHLGDLLRLSLETRDKQEIPLAEELAFLDHYLAIQKIRFGDRLRVETQIAPDVKYAAVPSLFIQPLVENAIRHGISSRSSGGTVTVTAQLSDNQLQIRVIDDGVGLPDGWTLEESAGLGLSITRDRITGLHPDGASRFSIQPRAGGGTEAEIRLPLRMIGERADAHALA